MGSLLWTGRRELSFSSSGVPRRVALPGRERRSLGRFMALAINLDAVQDATEVTGPHCAVFGGTADAARKVIARYIRDGNVFVARRRGTVIASLVLTPKKPWAIDASYFTPVRLPLYLLGMAVAPELQRTGIGRKCLISAEKIAVAWPAQAIRLDAFDLPTGAGGFYRHRGYREVGRVVYRQTPLVYYEHLLDPTSAT